MGIREGGQHGAPGLESPDFVPIKSEDVVPKFGETWNCM